MHGEEYIFYIIIHNYVFIVNIFGKISLYLYTFAEYKLQNRTQIEHILTFSIVITIAGR